MRHPPSIFPGLALIAPLPTAYGGTRSSATPTASQLRATATPDAFAPQDIKNPTAGTWYAPGHGPTHSAS